MCQFLVHVHDSSVRLLVLVALLNRWKRISCRLIGHNHSSRNVAPVRHGHTDDGCPGLKHTVISDLSHEDERLHPDKRVVADLCRTMHMRLMRKRDSIPDVDRVLLSIHCVCAPLDLVAVLVNGLERVDNHTILNIGIISDMKRHPLVTTHSCLWRYHHILSNL